MIPYFNYYSKFILKNRKNFINPHLVRKKKLNVVEKSLILKHDVECSINKMETMAKIESKNNVSSIWLLQAHLLNDSNIKVFKKIISLGHIIGYHYDVLDSNNGDYYKALDDFISVKNWFDKNIEQLEFVCPHGNPLKKRNGYDSNKDFWIRYKNKFDNITDLVMDFDGVSYSDVSYGFYRIERLGPKKNKEKLEKVPFDIINPNQTAVVSIHSHRWSKFYFIALFYYFRFHVLKSVYKVISKNIFFKILISRFYKTSKYI